MASRPLAVILIFSAAGGCDPNLENDYGTLASLYATSRADLEYTPQFAAPQDCFAPSTDIDPRRSLIDTEIVDLNGSTSFQLGRLLGQLARQSGEPNPSELGLFFRLWDSQTPGPDPQGFPRCTDNGGTLNGFSNSCLPVYPYDLLNLSYQQSFPIAAVNRFDLTDNGQTHCGEYRLIYKLDAPGGALRILINFEARVPNPTPGCIEGCREIQSYWQALSACDDPATRARLLENIFFTGAGNTAPAVSIQHYAGGEGAYGASAPSGQIRLLGVHRSNANIPPVMKEMTIRMVNGKLTFQPRAVRGNPYGELFAASNTSPIALAFRAPSTSGGFLDSVDELAINDLNRFGLDPRMDSRFFAADSPIHLQNDYRTQFLASPQPVFGGQIGQRLPIQACIPTVHNILDRATAVSCAGCHGLSSDKDLGCGLTWPSALGFLHVDPDTSDEPSGGSTRYAISPALKNTFLPLREQFLENFLSSTRNCGVAARGTAGSAPLTGMRVH